MRLIKKILLIFFIFNITLTSVKAVPSSFADLAEKLMPSVVNISTTQTVRTTSNQFPFQFPPGSPFEEMFKDFQRPTERKASSLGSGFIIKENGIVITNNHVISGADDILVKVNSKEYEAAQKSVLDSVDGIKEEFSWAKDVIIAKMIRELTEKVESEEE